MASFNDNLGTSRLDNVFSEEHEGLRFEPIAIVGMGCRLPGGVSSPSDLWELLNQGRSGHSKIPQSRFNVQGFYHPDLNHPSSINATGGYFLNDDIRNFENGVFGINNLEAKYMDPQQRKLLEVVYECCENAGLPLEKLSGANVGCYVANFTSDYQLSQVKDPDSFHRYSATGMGLTILANRLSHVFDLRGPSMVLDTACSSSLYSLHSACTALNTGECDGAIVAGANLIQSPEVHIATAKTGVLSGTSQCHTFDKSADGYGRGEGVGALFLKKLSDAVRDGDPIRSVIRGTAANSNGKTNGIALPSAAGQEAVIRKAYKRAGLDLDGTDYVEAHGTGTPVGDPIEIEALSRVFHHRTGRKLLVGSIKPNLGHSEAVSGISSVVKVALALENKSIPRTIGITQINPELQVDERNVKIVTELTSWPESTVRRASINSFGYGGANAHVILEAADAHIPITRESTPNSPCLGTSLLLPLSAHSRLSLHRLVEDLSTSNIRSHRLEDLAFTLSCRRSHLSSRGFLLVHDDTMSSDLHPSRLQILEAADKPSKLPLAFIFTGQGAQWATMGIHLLDRFSTFHRTIQELDNSLASLSNPPSWTIEGTIREPERSSAISHVSHSQPICTAIQIGLVELIWEWGLHPQAVVGHSSGEIAAAFAAGHITAAEAIAVAYHRGQVLLRSPSKGAMIALGLDNGSTSKILRELSLQDKLVIACVNSPEDVTVSGDEEAVDALAACCQEKDIFARKLSTDGRAYHSKHMFSVGQDYENILSKTYFHAESCQPKLAKIPMISSVTSKLIEPSQTRSASYWRKNLESPVDFFGALQTLFLGHEYHIIEVGPHPALRLPIARTQKALDIKESKSLYSPTLCRSVSSVTSMLQLAGSLFLHMHEVDIDKINHYNSPSSRSTRAVAKRHVLHSLPNYKWNYGPLLWHESRVSRDFRNRRCPPHELLGTRVPGDNGKTITWRNSLKTKDVPWLGDHKLGQTVVFPAAGYLAIAIEALHQALESKRHLSSVLTFRQVKFLEALALLDENSSVELLTELRPLQISSTTISKVWWQFETSSHTCHMTTIHANGYLGLDMIPQAISPALDFSTASMEWQSMHNWYKRMPICNINPGPSFHSLTEIMVDRMKSARQALAKTIPRVESFTAYGEKAHYSIHPTTIDAMLQTAWIASAAGSIENLKGQVPVSIGAIKITTPVNPLLLGSQIIRGASELVGYHSAKYSSELYDLEGNIQLQMQDMRAVPYQEGTVQMSTSVDRYPMLRIRWKPDVSMLKSDNLQALENWADEISPVVRFQNPDARNIAGILDLLAHKNPNSKILMLGDYNREITSSFLELLHADTPLRRFQSFTWASLTVSGPCISEDADNLNHQYSLRAATIQEGVLFDIIVLPFTTYIESCLDNRVKQALDYLADFGNLLFVADPAMTAQAPSDRFSIMLAPSRKSVNNAVILTRAGRLAPPRNYKHTATIFLIGRTQDGVFNDALQTKLSSLHGQRVVRMSLSDIARATMPARSVVISTIELRKPVVGALSATDIRSLNLIFEKASILLWITGGNLYKAERPEFAPVFGLSRSVMLELPSINFIVLDVDTTQQELKAAERNILLLLQQAMYSSKMDLEYLQYNGILHVSRIIPDLCMNRRFRNKQHEEAVNLPLQDVGNCQLSIKHVGQMDTIHFVTKANQDSLLESDFVEVQAKVLGLNAKDVHVLSGRFDAMNATCSAEISGIIKRVGLKVTKLTPGDRVVVMAPNHFANVEQVPEWACCKLRDHEDFALMATIPGIFSTALYALHHRAHLQKGESILIHSAASGVGIAAIQIAKLCDANIYATVSTVEKKQFLIETFGLEPTHIFSSRDSTFLPALLRETSGQGVDVILNFLTGDLLHDCWRACAEFGRFVEIGKRDILDGGRLEMETFKRGATFTAFDLSNLYYSTSISHRTTWENLLHESIQLHRDGKIRFCPPPKVFDVSDVVQAFRAVSLSSRIGKIAVSLENPDSIISFVRPRYEASLDPNKSYFLVGCLGGLGRSIARWMFDRGARSFVFLGRSGTEKREAKDLVDDLRRGGAHVHTVCGNVNSYRDVEEAITRIPGPIGGVVQAAMGLDEALFAGMSSDKWRTSTDPKIQGTWNIHNALKGKDNSLDFFLLTSSISGSVGTATESNYCSANAFLDAFARYRRSLGMPAISIGLGMVSGVGYLHEHPDIEALLLRKGLRAITESELLQIVDIVLTEKPPSNASHGSQHLIQGHVLTGLEAQGLQDIREKGFEGGSHVLDDPRTSIMAKVLSDNNGESTGSVIENSLSSHCLPKSVATALAANNIDNDALTEALESIVGEKVRNLLLLPVEQLDGKTHLSDFGLDSMLAAEFRQFIYRVFEVDVSFIMLLSKTTTVASLAKLVAEGLLESKTVNRIE